MLSRKNPAHRSGDGVEVPLPNEALQQGDVRRVQGVQFVALRVISAEPAVEHVGGVDHRLIWLKQHIDRDDLIVCRGGRRYAARRTGRDKAERQRK